MAAATSTVTIVPEKLKNLRACLRCHLVKTFDQFARDSCENCKRLYNLNDITDQSSKQERVEELTTQDFDGLIGMMIPGPKVNHSWVSQWQTITKCVPGCYAVTVSGIIPEEFRGEDDFLDEANAEEEDADYEPHAVMDKDQDNDDDGVTDQ